MGAPPTPLTPGQPAPLAPGEFTGASVPNVVTFSSKNLGPPSPLYIQRDDQLVVESASWAVPTRIIFRGRLLLPTGVVNPIEISIEAPAAGTTAIRTVPLAEGFLLSFVAVSLTSTARGNVFVRAYINRGKSVAVTPNAAAILFADYVTDTGPVGWPGGRILSPLEGPGFLQKQAAPAPAAGADFTYTVNANSNEKIRCLRAVLATSAAAGNRTPSFRIIDPIGNVLASSGNNNTQIANQTVGYTLGIGMTAVQVAAAEFIAPLPGDLLLPASSTITSVTGGILAADQWNPINVLVERWVALESV